MNIESKILEISKSLDEKQFNKLISLILSTNIQTKKNICEIVFKKIDSELTNNTPNEKFLRTLIAVPIELAIQEYIHKKNTPTENQMFTDFVSSHLLARSNIPNHSLRIAISVFYSHIIDQPIWKKQKILERFGENILNSIFQIYAAKDKKSSMALSFLFENFESFLSLSPELAAMTNQFLQKLMLQKTDDFINFMEQYRRFLEKRDHSAEFFVIHMSFLIQYIFELNHDTLVGFMLKTFIDYVYGYKADIIQTTKNFQILAKILLQSKNNTAQDIGVYIQTALANDQKISCVQLFKQINLKNSQITVNKKKKDLNTLSPFQKIAFLHNDN